MPSIRPSRLRRLLLAAAVLVSFTSAATAQAQDDANTVDMKKGKWADLVQYIGTTDYAAVLAHEDVKAGIGKILKGKDVDLQKEFGVAAPIGFESDCLILKGAVAHEADSHRAYLEVCVGQGDVNLAVFDSGKISVYSQFNDYKYMSDGMKNWIYFQNNDASLEKKPDNVQLVVQAN